MSLKQILDLTIFRQNESIEHVLQLIASDYIRLPTENPEAPKFNCLKRQ